MAKVRIASIESVCQDAFLILGVPKDQARIITDSIVYAHRRAKGTHGIGRLPIYARKIKAGVMNPDTTLTLVSTRRAVDVLDAHHGFGQVAGVEGMRSAVSKAAQHGVGVIGVRNSNNFGTAGFIVEEALEKGMIGLVFANSAPAIAPTGGSQPLFGTNPIGIAFPTPEGFAPIVLDMATSVAARGKIRLAAKQGERIPMGWALDSDGQPTDDPNAALKGSMVPIGGAKGYGLSLSVDLLAGLLTGSGFGGAVLPLATMEGNSGYGHLLMALDVEAFMDRSTYLANMEVFLAKVKGMGEQVMLPGERSFRSAQAQLEEVEVASKQIEEVNALANEMGLEHSLDILS
jgi:L-2-hydroxycarboxylate dehydrogenase (NAD+)